ncbi:MAG: hypothetical protein WCY33_02725 [Clostridia bacterium]|jgi:hypothetical protein
MSFPIKRMDGEYVRCPLCGGMNVCKEHLACIDDGLVDIFVIRCQQCSIMIEADDNDSYRVSIGDMAEWDKLFSYNKKGEKK